MSSIRLLQGNSAFHHRDVARERAEETVLLASIELRHVEGHRVGFLGADDFGVGDDARITFRQVALLDTCGQAAVAIGCMSASLLSTQLWPMTFFGRLPECFSSTVNVLQLLSMFIGLGVEGHLISRVDSDLAFGSHQLAAGQCQQGYRNKFGKHGESPRQG